MLWVVFDSPFVPTGKPPVSICNDINHLTSPLTCLILEHVHANFGEDIEYPTTSWLKSVTASPLMKSLQPLLTWSNPTKRNVGDSINHLIHSHDLPYCLQTSPNASATTRKQPLNRINVDAHILITEEVLGRSAITLNVWSTIATEHKASARFPIRQQRQL